MASSVVIPAAISSAATLPATLKAALPVLTVMLINGAKDFIFASLLLIAGWIAARWARRGAHDLIARGHHLDDTLKPLIENFIQYGILAVTILLVLGQFGVQTTSLIALLGAVGLAIGLALQGTLSNVASGAMLLILRPFRVNEKIKVSDAVGRVREIGLFRTEIVTDEGVFVSIPNATIFSGTIANVTRETMRRTNFTVEVDRAENLDDVQKAILDVLVQEPRVLKSPAPLVEVTSLGPLSTVLTVEAWAENRVFGAAQSDVMKKVRHALQAASIQAPVPVGAPAVAPWPPEPPDVQAKNPN